MKKISKLLLIGLLLTWGCHGAEGVRVTIVSGESGEEIGRFQAELADEAGERSLGLMFRRDLPEDRGMLFIFPEDTQTPFWMKNTLISLDIIFIDLDHRVVSLAAEAQPQSTELLYPEGPYRFVLEIPGGRAAELGIQAGDRVEFKLP